METLALRVIKAMGALKGAASVLLGLSAGFVVAGAVFAFIAAIGIVPRLAAKTGTNKYVKIYEESIIVGGLAGVSTYLFDFTLPLKAFGAVPLAIFYGMFVGCLALCLAEVLNVLPVLARRVNLQKGIGIFIAAFAIGKLCGSLMYFFIPGFFEL